MSNYLTVGIDFVVDVVVVVGITVVLIALEETIHVVFVKALLVVFSIVLKLIIFEHLVV